MKIKSMILFSALLLAVAFGALSCKKGEKKGETFSDPDTAITETPDREAQTNEAPQKEAEKKPETTKSPARDVINDMRMLIRNGRLPEAKKYVDALNPEKESADTGEIYHFKGVIYFLLAQKNNNGAYITTAVQSFQKANRTTKKEKIRALSLLWAGMVYEYFYTASEPEELERGIAFLDRVLNEYPKTRFANDALFYKALIYREMGNREYYTMFDQVKEGGFSDVHVYFKWTKRYVRADQAVEMVLYGEVN